jgi:hypothetical protein
MKYLAVIIALPLLVSSCAILQMPARLIRYVIAPLTSNETGSSLDETSGVALKYSPAHPLKK